MRTIAVLVLVLLVVALALWAVRQRRTASLRQRFGGEYDRAVDRAGSRREAEQGLTEIARRRDALELHPLSAAQRHSWTEQWGAVQARFVDAPAEAVADARDLLPALMRERGYPVEDFDSRAALLAADHPVVVGEYRAAEDAYRRHEASGGSSTESLRQALVHYRALFEALVSPDGDGDAPDGSAHDEVTPDGEAVTTDGDALHGRHAADGVPPTATDRPDVIDRTDRTDRTDLTDLTDRTVTAHSDTDQRLDTDQRRSTR